MNAATAGVKCTQAAAQSRAVKVPSVRSTQVIGSDKGELYTQGLSGTLPFTYGSVDGGATNGVGTIGGRLGFPLLIGTICMGATSIFFIINAYRKPETAKYQYVSFAVTGIATIAYLCMRCNIGVHYVECAHGSCGQSHALQSNGGQFYPLFWMRYVDWFFTTPFFLLDLCILAQADPFDTFFVMMMNAVCIAAGAVGALKPSANVPFFILGMATFVGFIHKLMTIGDADKVGKERVAHYKKVMMLTMGIWCAYPVMFLLCELTKTVPSDVEIWLYMILDVAAKCGCGLLLVSKHFPDKAAP